MPGNPWSKAEDAILTRLWGQGTDAKTIALEPALVANRRTRMSVISRAHRLGLAAHKSQCVTGRKAGITVASAHKPVWMPKPPAAESVPATDPITPFPTPKDSLVERATGAVEAVLALAPKACRFPIGDPRSPDFHFCGAPQVPGLSYCAPCAKKAYQPPTIRIRADDRLRQTAVTPKEKQSV